MKLFLFAFLLQSYISIVSASSDEMIRVGGGGDPHYYLRGGDLITVQAMCAIVLLQGKVFGMDFQVHSRHHRPEREEIFPQDQDYTYISSIGIQLGDDVFTLEAEEARLFKNFKRISEGIYAFEDNEYNEEGELVEEVMVPEYIKDKYSIQKKLLKEETQVQYIISFTEDDASKIYLRTHLDYDMVFMSMTGSFGNANLQGFLGDYKRKGLYARDGRLMAKKAMDVDIEEYTNEWQVLASEPMLFRDHTYFPQLPYHQCLFVDTMHGVEEASMSGRRKTMWKLRKGQRRLSMEEEDTRKVEKRLYAKKICSHHAKKQRRAIKVQWCVEDVLKTGHEELAKDHFYD